MARPPCPPLAGGDLAGRSFVINGGDETMKNGSFLPYERRLTAFARENRRNPTPAELQMWGQLLRNRQFGGYKFVRQKPVGGYVVDFYCAELRLVIEIDGDSHAEQVAYDARRTRQLEALGLMVLRYSNRDVLQALDGVYSDLSTKLASRAPSPEKGRGLPGGE